MALNQTYATESVEDTRTSIERTLDSLDFSLSNLEAAFRDLGGKMDGLLAPQVVEAISGVKSSGSEPAESAVIYRIRNYINRVESLRDDVNTTRERL